MPKTLTPLRRAGDGVYETQDGRYSVQNPHKMDPGDPDHQWYVLEEGVAPPNGTHGPFDTLAEVRNYLAGRAARVYSRGGKKSGVIVGSRLCNLEGCRGLKLCVRWSDGKRTWPCTKGMFVRKDGHWQILD